MAKKALYSPDNGTAILCIGGCLMIWINGEYYMFPNPETYKGHTAEIVDVDTSFDDTPEQMLEKIKEAYANATKK